MGTPNAETGESKVGFDLKFKATGGSADNEAALNHTGFYSYELKLRDMEVIAFDNIIIEMGKGQGTYSSPQSLVRINPHYL